MRKSDFKLILQWTPELRRRSYKCKDERKKIYADDEVLAQIKDKSRMAYVKSWKDFKNFNIDFEFDEGHPEEEAIIVYFKHLKLEKKMATTTTSTVSWRESTAGSFRPFPGSQWRWWAI